MSSYPAVLYDPQGRGGGGFTRKMRVYSSSFLSLVLERPEKARTLEKQDKAILFSGLLRGLSCIWSSTYLIWLANALFLFIAILRFVELHSKVEAGEPLIFELHNEIVGKKIFCGVLEFSGEEHNCAYIPEWIMHNLG